MGRGGGLRLTAPKQWSRLNQTKQVKSIRREISGLKEATQAGQKLISFEGAKRQVPLSLYALAYRTSTSVAFLWRRNWKCGRWSERGEEEHSTCFIAADRPKHYHERDELEKSCMLASYSSPFRQNASSHIASPPSRTRKEFVRKFRRLFAEASTVDRWTVATPKNRFVQKSRSMSNADADNAHFLLRPLVQCLFDGYFRLRKVPFKGRCPRNMNAKTASFLI